MRVANSSVSISLVDGDDEEDEAMIETLTLGDNVVQFMIMRTGVEMTTSNKEWRRMPHAEYELRKGLMKAAGWE